ncbi:hypothetical protein [Planktotalea arctica]|uniref:hypothetical protein n=1 Tax=Planktotalea arctica TaxID=1481893 RepID=UPI00321935BA
MVNTSKVLTVSYGTFSCTLEGFDDSFDTMKAIAEYFRDLAADDRYFGAEPPTPDAEMLARIAEREVSRRVEAHSDGGNIVLRTQLPVSGAIAKPKGPLENNPGPLEADLDTSEAEQARLEEERIAHEAAARAQAKAERHARIAQQKAQAEAEAAQEAEAKAARAQAEKDAAEQAALNEAAALEAQADAKARADEEAARLAQEELEQAQEDARRTQQAAQAAARENAAKAELEDNNDSVAAKLARIRAVVGQPGKAPTAPAYSEDEHADEIMQGRDDDTDLEDLIEPDSEPVSEAQNTAKSLTQTEDAISGVISPLAKQTEPQIEPAPTEAVAEVVPTAATAPTAPIRARVIKMKREEFEAAIASGDIEEDDDVDDSAQAEAPSVTAAPIASKPAIDSSLSDSEEDELARELAAVEAELAGLSASEPVPAPAQDLEPVLEQNVPETPAATRGSDDLALTPDVEVDRLMDQATSELEEPDGKKRRNALGHLRAAVAAARADKGSGGNAEQVDETESYRNDLESAVQPRRPVRRLTPNESAPVLARPPLKLVAEQRVDTPAPAPLQSEAPQPVRPRRIKAGQTPSPAAVQPLDSNIAPEGGSFQEFAEEMSATELPDLLEAAAAYLAYVEGKEQFSRPQLMTKVRMVQEENFSREDGLRSFGQLLRQGKIEKISGGRFTVSDRISFKPDTRAAG